MGIDVPIFSPKEMLQFKIEFAPEHLTKAQFIIYNELICARVCSCIGEAQKKER